MDLLQRHRRVEPVKRLSDDDAVNGRVLEWNGDIPTVEDVHFWESLAQYISHARCRLDGRDVRAIRNQLSGEDSRARAEVEDVRVVLDAQRVDEERDRIVGIVRSRVLVAPAVSKTGRAVVMWVLGQVRHPDCGVHPNLRGIHFESAENETAVRRS